MGESSRPVVVMKFGGTSVGTEEGRAALVSRVDTALSQGKAPVVVVSAMGRAPDPYATDTLLGLVADKPSDPREHDLLASVGETIAAVTLAHELRAAGIAAAAFSGPEAGITTDGRYQASAVVSVHPGPLSAAIQAGTVPVVAGFQGMSEDGRLTTLGRGGSDTTACALGVALGADEVEIYTDVDGVMTADPKSCEHADVLERIRADELFQMAYNGSRVVHTPAADLALESGLSLRVRNTYSEHPGTEVVDVAAYRPSTVATSVSCIDDLARVRVALPAPEGSSAHMAAQSRVYRVMADAGVSLDMFTPVGETLVFSIRESDLDSACEVLSGLGLTHQVQARLAKVTLIGAGMHGVPGVMARMAEQLADAGVTVLQTADSHATISVLVHTEDAAAAVKALHEGFELGEAAD